MSSPFGTMPFVMVLVVLLFTSGAVPPSVRASSRQGEVVALARTLAEKATDSETFGPRRALLRDALLHRRSTPASSSLPTLARVLNLGALFAQDRGAACRKLDAFLRSTARVFAAAAPVASEPSSVAPSRESRSAGVPPARLPKSSVAKPEGPADREALRGLIRSVEEEPTSKESFLARWQIMADFVKRLPPRVRKDELFGYAELVRCKLTWYGDATGASMALDEFVGQAAEWLRAGS